MPPNGTWLPTITLESLLVALQTLMGNPNPDDPLRMDLAKEYKYDQSTFNATALQYTMKYAVE